jgi:hypothetical protein
VNTAAYFLHHHQIMIYPFQQSEQLVRLFEELLKTNGITIQSDSDLERVCLKAMEINAKYKKEITHNNRTDIRKDFAEMAGLTDFMQQITKHQNHKDFNKLILHLNLLNTADNSVLTTKSKITDDSNNKLFELYIALLWMTFSQNIELDNPKNSKGDNPDIMFDFLNKKWAIACKSLHSNKEKTLFDRLEEGVDQINRSNADKGIVIVNFKNIVDIDKIFPYRIEKKEYIYDPFLNIEEPLTIMHSYSTDFCTRLNSTVGNETLIEKLHNQKCFACYLSFLHSTTCIKLNGSNTATILKEINLTYFENITDEEYLSLSECLNKSMHNLI